MQTDGFIECARCSDRLDYLAKNRARTLRSNSTPLPYPSHETINTVPPGGLYSSKYDVVVQLGNGCIASAFSQVAAGMRRGVLGNGMGFPKPSKSFVRLRCHTDTESVGVAGANAGVVVGLGDVVLVSQ